MWHSIYLQDKKVNALKNMPFVELKARVLYFYCDDLDTCIVEHYFIYKGQCIGRLDGHFVYVPFGGQVTRIKEEYFKYNQKRKLIEISIHEETCNLYKNDFWKKMLNYDKNLLGEDYLKILGLDLSVMIVNQKCLKEKITWHTFWIDGVDSETPGYVNERLLLENHLKVLLGIDFIARLFHIKQVIFCVTYEDDFIAKCLCKDLKKYEILLESPIKYDIQYVDPVYPLPFYTKEQPVIMPWAGVYAYEGIYEQKNASRLWVSVSGENLQSGNYVVYLGTKVIDLLLQCGYQRNSSTKIIINGLMSGKSVSETYILSLGDYSVHVIHKTHFKEKECIYCLSCASVCPKHLKPYQVNRYVFDQCMYCGNCSYVCPSNRRLTERIRRHDYQNIENKHAGNEKIIESQYVEVAEEIIPYLENLDVESDAPPHLKKAQKGLYVYWILTLMMIPLILMYMKHLGKSYLLFLVVNLCASVIGTEIRFCKVGLDKYKYYYGYAIFWSVFMSIILPVNTSLLLVIAINIIACILQVHNL